MGRAVVGGLHIATGIGKGSPSITDLQASEKHKLRQKMWLQRMLQNHMTRKGT
jgi:hypothetical protein